MQVEIWGSGDSALRECSDELENSLNIHTIEELFGKVLFRKLVHDVLGIFLPTH